MSIRIMQGDCRRTLAALPAGSVQTCVTSPPYFGLRAYLPDGHPDKALEIGAERTPDEYASALVEVFREVRRVLRDDGTLWLNLGDAFGAGKQLLLLPHRVALALQADGWVVRQSIVWHKLTAMPDAAKDRPSSAHESVFLMAKGERYFYDVSALAEPASGTDERPQLRRARQLAARAGLTPAHIAAIRACGVTDVGKARLTQDGLGKNTAEKMRLAAEAKAVLGGYYREFLLAATRNTCNVWSIAAQPSPIAHLAMMPSELAERCIKAGSRAGETVLDPFGGSGTTAVVADRLGRDAVICELSAEHAATARRRIVDDAPLLVAAE